MAKGLLAALVALPCAAGAAPSFTPPPADKIPPGPYGEMVTLGREIFADPGKYASDFVGNKLRCTNCHFDSGRQAGVGPLWAAWVAYPAYRAKTRQVDTYEERLRGCFMYSMNGKAPPLGDKVLVALETYSAWLATGAPVGAEMVGRGYPKLAAPVSEPDYERGKTVFGQKCAVCHGSDGAGQSAGGQMLFPALWGSSSFNWGAGMGGVNVAAAFIKANMPLGAGGSLSDQQAWDVALFVDSHERPQDPRFTGSVAETRRLFHASPFSMYGQTVAGQVLGGHSVPGGGTTRAGG